MVNQLIRVFCYSAGLISPLHLHLSLPTAAFMCREAHCQTRAYEGRRMSQRQIIGKGGKGDITS